MVIQVIRDGQVIWIVFMLVFAFLMAGIVTNPPESRVLGKVLFVVSLLMVPVFGILSAISIMG